MFRFPFSLPPYYISIIRCLGVLEGVALQVDENFRIIDDAYPYIASRLLTDSAEAPTFTAKVPSSLSAVSTEVIVREPQCGTGSERWNVTCWKDARSWSTIHPAGTTNVTGFASATRSRDSTATLNEAVRPCSSIVTRSGGCDATANSARVVLNVLA